MEITNCRVCKKSAKAICTVCNVLICAKHRSKHIDDQKDHNIIKYKPLMNSKLKSKATIDLLAKIKIMDQSYKEVLELTNSIGTEFLQQSQLTLQKIDNMRTRYFHLSQALGNEILKEQVSEIEEILSTVIVYEKFSLSDEFQY